MKFKVLKLENIAHHLPLHVVNKLTTYRFHLKSLNYSKMVFWGKAFILVSILSGNDFSLVVFLVNLHRDSQQSTQNLILCKVTTWMSNIYPESSPMKNIQNKRRLR